MVALKNKEGLMTELWIVALDLTKNKVVGEL